MITTLFGRRMLAITMAAIAINAPPAGAISRVPSLSHSCAQLRQIIASQGAVIVTHPGSRASGTLYDRYVSDSGYCNPSEVATSDWVPAKDGSCRLYNCQNFEPLFDNR
ncbi:hypothetical protein [Rhizobium tubonense]|uniref:hypothetical protein n=1 Tax=Rhizobium tubonense TaxID=484088 RepID=UPI0018A7F51E|nr:hypothetical protein [Rhizobium tubonense]